MAVVRLDTACIVGWSSFHHAFRNLMGFPGFYGGNMNAWIDCMSYLDQDAGMTKIALGFDEILLIEVTDTERFNARVPDVVTALIECTAFVNQRYIAAGQTAKIALVFL
jgi:RNAse (barnase) inhibitor barstar